MAHNRTRQPPPLVEDLSGGKEPCVPIPVFAGTVACARPPMQFDYILQPCPGKCRAARNLVQLGDVVGC